MKIGFADAPPPGVALVLGVGKGALPPSSAALDARYGGALAAAVAGHFTGKAGTWQALVLGGTQPVVLVGLDGDASAWREAGGAAAAALGATGWRRAAAVLDGGGAALGAFAQGARLGAYRFDPYRTRARAEDPVAVDEIVVTGPRWAAGRRAWAALEPAVTGALLARDLANEPANRLTPEDFVARAAEALTPQGVDLEALDVPRLRALGMGALLAVGQGSVNEPRLLVLRWNGAGGGGPPLAFVGKGLTFDSGGISIKKAQGMELMKGDMAGGAAVVGVMSALAARRARIDAVGVVGLAENMPSERSYRPGDVLTTMAGTTVEVIDTDAEGRLVLADALWYTATIFKPAAMVDLATLTYSISAGLGQVYAGLFATDDTLAKDLLAAATAEDERLWRMPLHPAYDDNLKSPIADVRQVAPDEAHGDAPHAAQFLARFTAGRPWAHLDIAGVDLLPEDSALGPKGASGFGVRLLDRFAVARERRLARMRR